MPHDDFHFTSASTLPLESVADLYTRTFADYFYDAFISAEHMERRPIPGPRTRRAVMRRRHSTGAARRVEQVIALLSHLKQMHRHIVCGNEPDGSPMLNAFAAAGFRNSARRFEMVMDL